MITKRGKQVAKLVPVEQDEEKDPIFGFLAGKIKNLGNIESPIPEEEWEISK